MKRKICIISDLHGILPEIRYNVDILCICGDIIPNNIQYNFDESIKWLQNDFINWTNNIPVKKIIMVWGNHDFIGEHLYNSYIFNQSKYIFGNNSNIHILCDKSVEIYGIKFYGTSWCPDLKQWAFYGPNIFLNTIYLKIPKDIDILLTHCPPKVGQQGIVLEPGNDFLKNYGCEELDNAINKIFKDKKSKTYIFSGHIHSGNHEYEMKNNCIYRNVSLLDENYNYKYYPLYIDYNVSLIKIFIKKILKYFKK